MSSNHVHNWDQSGDLEVIEQGHGYAVWQEREYCDLCYVVKISTIEAQCDDDGDILSTKKTEEKIRPQTSKEMEDAPPK